MSHHQMSDECNMLLFCTHSAKFVGKRMIRKTPYSRRLDSDRENFIKMLRFLTKPRVCEPDLEKLHTYNLNTFITIP